MGMKVVMLYRPTSEHARATEEFIREFQQRSSHQLEVIDVDSQAGVQKVELYDAMEYPALLATTDSGQLQKMWTGTPLPLVNDVLGYIAH